MGVDLKLMPVLSEGAWICHEMVALSRDRDLWTAISELDEIPVGREVWCHYATAADGESCYGEVRVTPYDTPLTWLPAGRLAQALREYDQAMIGWRNKAAAAYLSEMPPSWPVVLYWH